jgi:carbon storage regulator
VTFHGWRRAPMLVLTRRAGESVMIGDDVVITVLEARGDVIRLGIQAPRDVQVHREEVYRELQEANRAAASPTEDAVHALAKMLEKPDTPD